MSPTVSKHAVPRTPVLSVESNRSAERRELERLRVDNVKLVGQLSRLRVALERSATENAYLRRTLAAAELESRSARPSVQTRSSERNRAERVRAMLRDRGSRNP
jgi:hypothetical protein